MGKRKYSDVEKAEALAHLTANGNNLFRTSHELGIPYTTLTDWFKGTRGINESITEMREEKEQELAEIFENIARKYLKQAGDPWAIALTPGNVAVTAAAIATDKLQLLKGQPTSIIADVSNPADRAAKSVDMISQWKERRAKAS